MKIYWKNIQVWWSISAGTLHPPRPCGAVWCPEEEWRCGGKSWTPVSQSEPASWRGSSTDGPSCRSERFLGSGSTRTQTKNMCYEDQKANSIISPFFKLRLPRDTSLDQIHSFSPSGVLQGPWNQETSCGVPSSPASHGFLHEPNTQSSHHSFLLL